MDPAVQRGMKTPPQQAEPRVTRGLDGDGRCNPLVSMCLRRDSNPQHISCGHLEPQPGVTGTTAQPRMRTQPPPLSRRAARAPRTLPSRPAPPRSRALCATALEEEAAVSEAADSP